MATERMMAARRRGMRSRGQTLGGLGWRRPLSRNERPGSLRRHSGLGRSSALGTGVGLRRLTLPFTTTGFPLAQGERRAQGQRPRSGSERD